MEKQLIGLGQEPDASDRRCSGRSEATDGVLPHPSNSSTKWEVNMLKGPALPIAEATQGGDAEGAYTKIREICFSDLFLGHPTLGDRYSDMPGAAINPLPAGTALRQDVERLKDACREARNRSPSLAEFRVNHDDVAYRAFVMNSLSGQVLVVRRIADEILSLADLGVPQAYIRHLMSRDLTGLFLISGGMKAGKTTTACALIKDRLNAFGGIAVTTEDPIELPLEGDHGEGVCYQTMGNGGGSLVDSFRHVVRLGAKTIFVGEIRDAQTASEVLQASTNGYLIVSTLHADNVIRTIMKLQAMASEEMEQSAVKSLLADGLAGVLHQKLSRGPKKKLETEFLFLKNAELARANIRLGKYEMLASDIKQQMACMIAENAMAQRRTGA